MPVPAGGTIIGFAHVPGGGDKVDVVELLVVEVDVLVEDVDVVELLVEVDVLVLVVGGDVLTWKQ